LSPVHLCFQAIDSRDAMAMNLYACTFKWVIRKINKRIKGQDHFSSIGLLDIFGFENFEVSGMHSFMAFLFLSLLFLYKPEPFDNLVYSRMIDKPRIEIK